MGSDNLLGYLDATNKNEIKEHLTRSAVITDCIQRAADRDVYFICGRRGTGKSAVLPILRNAKQYGLRNNDFDIVQGVLAEGNGAVISYADILNTLLSEIVGKINEGVDKNHVIFSVYSKLWTFFIDIIILKNASSYIRSDKELESEYDFINKYLIKKNALGNPVVCVIKKAVSLLAEVEKSPAPFSLFGALFSENLFTEHHQKAMECAKIIFKKYSMLLYFDTLEKYDIIGHQLDAVKSLCYVIKNIMSSGSYQNLHIKCSLPAEILDRVFSDNLQKYTEFSLILTWSYRDLLEMLCKRWCNMLEKQNIENKFNKCNLADKYQRMSAQESLEFWNEIAPATVKNKYGWSEPSFSYITRHTQKRPREIIKCMNSILDISRKKTSFPLITENDISDGLHDPSNLAFLLADNLAFYNIFPIKAEAELSYILKTAFVGEKIIFKGNELSKFAKKTYSILNCGRNEYQPKEIVELFIESGLLGRVVPQKDGLERRFPEKGENKIYYIVEFPYVAPSRIPLSDSAHYALHPILSDALRIVDFENSGIVYPYPEEDDLVSGLLSSD